MAVCVCVFKSVPPDFLVGITDVCLKCLPIMHLVGGLMPLTHLQHFAKSVCVCV